MRRTVVQKIFNGAFKLPFHDWRLKAVLVVITGADVAEKNLAGMNAHAGGQVEILDGAIEPKNGNGGV